MKTAIQKCPGMDVIALIQPTLEAAVPKRLEALNTYNTFSTRANPIDANAEYTIPSNV